MRLLRRSCEACACGKPRAEGEGTRLEAADGEAAARPLEFEMGGARLKRELLRRIALVAQVDEFIHRPIGCDIGETRLQGEAELCEICGIDRSQCIEPQRM